MVKKCKQCGNEFETEGRAKYCASCSREAATLHYRFDRLSGFPRPDGAGRGRLFYPRDQDRMREGFRLMGYNEDE